MITLFITAQIIFTLNAGVMPICKDLGYPILDGCYDGRDKIYISEITSRPKDYILYHEIGHSLFNKDFFRGRIKVFKDVEVMAENFAIYVYGYKYNFDYGLLPEYKKVFEKKCSLKCLGEIISIKTFNGLA